MTFRASILFALLFTISGIWQICRAGQNPTAAALSAHPDDHFTAFFRQTNHWSAGDVATTIPLSDGRVLWLFGDSYVDQFDPASATLPSLFNARNAALLQTTNDLWHPQTLCHFTAHDKSLFRPPGGPEFWPCFWPGTGFQNGKTIYILLDEIDKTPAGGMWGFKNVGQFWAKLSFPELKVIGYSELPSINGITFTAGFVKDETNKFIYAFGNRRRDTHSDVFVARFPTATPERDWTFWDGQDWIPNVTNATSIVQASSTSVNVCQVNGKFLLLTTAFSVQCDQGRDIYLLTSEHPTGPFSPPRKIFTVDDAVQGHHPFFYCVAAHPEFADDNGLLITYCINGYAPCVPTTLNGRINPDYYRPRAIRLPLK